MVYLVLLGILGALFAGFVLLTRYETQHTRRVFATWRDSLDVFADRTVFIATHVDFGSFVRAEARRLGAHLAHDAAHLTLISVRAVERLLTRLVRHLRLNHGIEPSASAAPRAFVKTMSDFKTHLSTTRPPVPEI